jgi:hypothetical protein
MGCFSTRKDIVIPPYIFEQDIIVNAGGKYIDGSKRSILVHFRGTIEWYHSNAIPELYVPKGASTQYSRGVRQFLLQEFKDDDQVKFFVGGSDSYIDEVKDSVFCLCPRGFAPWSRRLYDSILLGCIPVIIADYIELPFEDLIDYRKFTVKISEENVVFVKQILLTIPPEEIRKKQEYMKTIYHHFLFNLQVQPGDVFDYILRRLQYLKADYRVAAGDSWS